MVPISQEKRAIARRLRIEEKKSFREIASILGISKAVLVKWSNEEGWPNPQAERQQLRRVLAATRNPVKQQANAASGVHPDPWDQSPGQGAVSAQGEVAVAPFSEEIISLAAIEKMAEELLRFATRIVAEAARWDLKTAMKLLDHARQLYIAVRLPAVDESARKFSVMVPQVTEVYRDPPEPPPGGDTGPSDPDPEESRS